MVASVCDHHGFDVAHARVVGQLLDDLVSRGAGGAEHDTHTADGLHLAGGELVVAAVEYDDSLVFAAGEVDDVVDQTLARRVERIIGIVGMREPPLGNATQSATRCSRPPAGSSYAALPSRIPPFTYCALRVH